jgi:hypothetical protein
MPSKGRPARMALVFPGIMAQSKESGFNNINNQELFFLSLSLSSHDFCELPVETVFTY